MNTAVIAFKDPITVIHAGSTAANVDVGFLMNRANGLLANVALYWNESGNTFVTAFTSNSGATDSNIVVSSYAGLTTGNITATGDMNIAGNLTVTGTTTFVNSETVGGVEVVAGNLVANSGVASTSITTGALVVKGGAGIGGDIYISGNIIPSSNITYNLGTTTNRFKDLFLSGTTIDLGGAKISQDANSGAVAIIPTATADNPNPVATIFSPSGAVTTANTSGGVLSSANIASSAAASDFNVGGNLTANTATITNDVVISGNLTVAGNISINNAMIDRGTAGSNWNTITQMGTYVINRVSWSGTAGTPLDSLIYTGLLEVTNSANTAITQSYRPYDSSTVASVFWTRSKFNATWSNWREIVNGSGLMDGGSY
jgi:cytoskeletal protein CcmA (bactofilin family)